METSPTSHPDLVYARPPAAPGAGGAFPASLTCPVCGELASVPLSRRRTGVPAVAVATSSGLTPVCLASCVLASGAEAPAGNGSRVFSGAGRPSAGLLRVGVDSDPGPASKAVVGLLVTEPRRFLTRAACEPLPHRDLSRVSPVCTLCFHFLVLVRTKLKSLLMSRSLTFL